MIATTTELWPREIEVIYFVAHGLSSAEIGERLGITSSSVDVYLVRAQHKLGLQRRTQLVLYALKADWVDLENIELPGLAKEGEEVRSERRR